MVGSARPWGVLLCLTVMGSGMLVPCAGQVVGVSVKVPRWGGEGAGPSAQAVSWGLPAGLALQGAPRRCFGVTDCRESCNPCVITKGLFWETTGRFAFFSLFHLDFLLWWGTGWTSPGGSAAEMPILLEHAGHPSAVTQVAPEWFWTTCLSGRTLKHPLSCSVPQPLHGPLSHPTPPDAWGILPIL